jgi:hypothetical protein
LLRGFRGKFFDGLGKRAAQRNEFGRISHRRA